MALPEIDIRPRLIGLVLVMVLVVVLVAVPGIFPTQVQGQGNNESGEVSYFEDIADLPLAPGLTEQADRGLTFDKPDGRIIEAMAAGDVAPEAVIRFYQETLPALGWRLIGPKEAGSTAFRFAREGERLTLTVVTRYLEPGDQEQVTELQIELSPE